MEGPSEEVEREGTSPSSRKNKWMTPPKVSTANIAGDGLPKQDAVDGKDCRGATPTEDSATKHPPSKHQHVVACVTELLAVCRSIASATAISSAKEDSDEEDYDFLDSPKFAEKKAVSSSRDAGSFRSSAADNLPNGELQAGTPARQVGETTGNDVDDSTTGKNIHAVQEEGGGSLMIKPVAAVELEPGKNGFALSPKSGGSSPAAKRRKTESATPTQKKPDQPTFVDLDRCVWLVAELASEISERNRRAEGVPQRRGVRQLDHQHATPTEDGVNKLLEALASPAVGRALCDMLTLDETADTLEYEYPERRDAFDRSGAGSSSQHAEQRHNGRRNGRGRGNSYGSKHGGGGKRWGRGRGRSSRNRNNSRRTSNSKSPRAPQKQDEKIVATQYLQSVLSRFYDSVLYKADKFLEQRELVQKFPQLLHHATDFLKKMSLKLQSWLEKEERERWKAAEDKLVESCGGGRGGSGAGALSGSTIGSSEYDFVTCGATGKILVPSTDDLGEGRLRDLSEKVFKILGSDMFRFSITNTERVEKESFLLHMALVLEFVAKLQAENCGGGTGAPPDPPLTRTGFLVMRLQEQARELRGLFFFVQGHGERMANWLHKLRTQKNKQIMDGFERQLRTTSDGASLLVQYRKKLDKVFQTEVKTRAHVATHFENYRESRSKEHMINRAPSGLEADFPALSSLLLGGPASTCSRGGDKWRSLLQPELRAGIARALDLPTAFLLTTETLAAILQTHFPQVCLVCRFLVKTTCEEIIRPEALLQLSEADGFERMMDDWPLPFPWTRSQHGAHKFGNFSEISLEKKHKHGSQLLMVSFIDEQGLFIELSADRFLRRHASDQVSDAELSEFLRSGALAYPNYAAEKLNSPTEDEARSASAKDFSLGDLVARLPRPDTQLPAGGPDASTAELEAFIRGDADGGKASPAPATPCGAVASALVGPGVLEVDVILQLAGLSVPDRGNEDEQLLVHTEGAAAVQNSSSNGAGGDSALHQVTARSLLLGNAPGTSAPNSCTGGSSWDSWEGHNYNTGSTTFEDTAQANRSRKWAPPKKPDKDFLEAIDVMLRPSDGPGGSVGERSRLNEQSNVNEAIENLGHQAADRGDGPDAGRGMMHSGNSGSTPPEGAGAGAHRSRGVAAESDTPMKGGPAPRFASLDQHNHSDAKNSVINDTPSEKPRTAGASADEQQDQLLKWMTGGGGGGSAGNRGAGGSGYDYGKHANLNFGKSMKGGVPGSSKEAAPFVMTGGKDKEGMYGKGKDAKMHMMMDKMAASGAAMSMGKDKMAAIQSMMYGKAEQYHYNMKGKGAGLQASVQQQHMMKQGSPLSGSACGPSGGHSGSLAEQYYYYGKGHPGMGGGFGVGYEMKGGAGVKGNGKDKGRLHPAADGGGKQEGTKPPERGIPIGWDTYNNFASPSSQAGPGLAGPTASKSGREGEIHLRPPATGHQTHSGEFGASGIMCPPGGKANPRGLNKGSQPSGISPHGAQSRGGSGLQRITKGRTDAPMMGGGEKGGGSAGKGSDNPNFIPVGGKAPGAKTNRNFAPICEGGKARNNAKQSQLQKRSQPPQEQEAEASRVTITH
eukprot:g5535.t1